jgi:serine/threonine protein kinase
MAKQTFGNRWELKSSLSEGGQAWIYLVRDVTSGLDTQYVLKRLKNIKRLGRFRAEIESLTHLDHPGIVRLIDFNVEEDSPWFVQEHCKGGDLEQYINKKGPLDTDTALGMFIEIASALEYAHGQNQIHRDIKPANIFLREKGDNAVLGDFGLVWKDDTGIRFTLTEEAVGSVHYIAPEVRDGKVDHPTWQCDIYSLGKVLYYMLSGGRVFDREVHRESRFDLVNILDDIRLEHVNNLLDHMITYDPEKRMPAKEVKREAIQAKRLIQGSYAPITGIFTSRCRFCGIGFYKPIINSDDEYISFFGFLPTAISHAIKKGWRVLTCDKCGHMEFFTMNNFPNPWWPERKR